MRKFNRFVCILAACMLAALMFTGCPDGNRNTCTVTFDPKNGNASSSIAVVKGTTVMQPNPPTKTNYAFAGWYHQNSNTSFNFSTQITSNITLEAHWTQTTTDIVSKPHMDVQGCQQGIKITLKTGVRDAGIHVFDGYHELPVYVETDNEQKVYYFPFTESGKEYTVKLDGVNTATDEWFGGDEGDHPFETATVKALGGSKFDDCINLSKFMNSTLVGQIDTSASYNSKYKVKLSSTQINNPSDIVKNSNLVKKIEFEFVLILGDDDLVGREEWWSGCGFDIDIPSTQNNSTLGNTLKTYRDLLVSNWHGANENNGVLTANRYEETFYAYKFRARMKFQAGSEETTYNGRFVTRDTIESSTHTYSPDAAGDNNVRVLSRPQMTLKDNTEYGQPSGGQQIKNHVHAAPGLNTPATFEIPLNAIKYGEDGATFNNWSQYDTMTITLLKSEGHEIMVYAKNTLTGQIQPLTSFDGGAWDHESQTIFIEDLNSFFGNAAAANKVIMLRVNEECLIKIASIKFQKYNHSTADFVIFDPDTTNVSNFGSHAQLVTLTDSDGPHKYLKVTTASVITGEGTSDTVVNLPTVNVPAGYMRIKAYCFVTDDKHTTSTSASNYYTFCFLLGDTDWNSATFMQRPLFNTNVNYKGNTSVDNQMRCQNGIPSGSFPVNRLWVWANNGKYKDDAFTKDNDFADLANKEFYIGKIVAYTPSDMN